MLYKICLQCNKEFSKSVFESKKCWENTRKFCCIDCYNKNKKGRISPIKGKRTGAIPWNKGLKFGKSPRNTTIEKACLECSNKFTVKNYRKDAAIFCSRVCHYKSSDKGKTSESYRIRRCAESIKWRELVFENNDWTCQKCLCRSGNGVTIILNAHHIYNFSENESIRFNVDNGITFCKKCHYKFHSIYGFKNNNKQQIEVFLSTQS